MNLASIRVITDDVPRLVAFYEQVTGVPARWATEQFAEVVTPAATLAIAHSGTVARLGGALRAAENRSVIVEFAVEDVDRVAATFPDGAEVVLPPTTMPWGNRSALVRDPDGNLVNFFTPGRRS